MFLHPILDANAQHDRLEIQAQQAYTYYIALRKYLTKGSHTNSMASLSHASGVVR